ncbi:hypothetical protein AVEN_55394-1 [Araneus ventricosus]|uniref:Uncharacterized protein n=1 Tax=Araneus ventricosus TaxID=182803 RepID=A0A4Y2RKU9_ARAVE|nr:hypothetical protein AVEN_55394-1 [Araneus ventricosus]
MICIDRTRIAPSDFHLFLKLKEFLGGKRFGSDEELENAVTIWLNELETEECDMGILKLVDRYDKCLNVEGDYVEKTTIKLKTYITLPHCLEASQGGPDPETRAGGLSRRVRPRNKSRRPHKEGQNPETRAGGLSRKARPRNKSRRPLKEDQNPETRAGGLSRKARPRNKSRRPHKEGQTQESDFGWRVREGFFSLDNREINNSEFKHVLI